MRCRNCCTVMMDTDLYCPSCRSSVANATAAPVEQSSSEPNGLLLLLPMFGGALGGLLYAGLAGSAPFSTTTTRRSSSLKPIQLVCGVILLLFSALILWAGFDHINATYQLSQREASVLQADDLSRMKDKDLKSAPDWVAYTFAESKSAKTTVNRRRLGKGGEVKAQCLFVRAEDKWLLATVDGAFEGERLVGRLVPLDASMKPTVDKFRKETVKSASVLPFEFNAIDGSASDQKFRYAVAGWILAFGVLGLMLGMWLTSLGLRSRR